MWAFQKIIILIMGPSKMVPLILGNPQVGNPSNLALAVWSWNPGMLMWFLGSLASWCYVCMLAIQAIAGTSPKT